jgi:hypothetical protein
VDLTEGIKLDVRKEMYGMLNELSREFGRR